MPRSKKLSKEAFDATERFIRLLFASKAKKPFCEVSVPALKALWEAKMSECGVVFTAALHQLRAAGGLQRRIQPGGRCGKSMRVWCLTCEHAAESRFSSTPKAQQKTHRPHKSASTPTTRVTGSRCAMSSSEDESPDFDD